VWPHLVEFFGVEVPAKVTVVDEEAGASHFDPNRNIVYISKESLQGKGGAAPISVCADVGHETAHLALARLTGGASYIDPFRFLDEGLATILQKEIDGTLPRYKRHALVLAARRLTAGSVRLPDLQAWSKYFGDPKVKADFDAYEVGSAFVFFVQDTRGNDALRKLYVDLGRTRALATSLSSVLGRTYDETEQDWEAYLRTVTIPHAPNITEMVPGNGATAVMPDMNELHVTFDTDMLPSICVMTKCNDGICYDRAYWKDARTLAIKIEKPLAPQQAYALTLGSPSHCALMSAEGVEAPITRWEFRTR